LHRGSNQCIWSELSKEVASNLFKTVVSLALSDGEYVMLYFLFFPNIYVNIVNYSRFKSKSCAGQEFACSGIAVECVGNVTRFLTSASLARALIDKSLDHEKLKVGAANHPLLSILLHNIIMIIVFSPFALLLQVEVRLGHDVVTGFLGQYDLDHNIAVVNVMSALDVHVIRLNNLVNLEPHCKVVALGHGIFDVHVMAADGILTGDSSGELQSSTCKISKVHLKYNMITLICFCQWRQ
jgi:hypothetical protein